MKEMCEKVFSHLSMMCLRTSQKEPERGAAAFTRGCVLISIAESHALHNSRVDVNR